MKVVLSKYDTRHVCDECGSEDETKLMRFGKEYPSWHEKTDNFYYVCFSCLNQAASDMVNNA